MGAGILPIALYRGSLFLLLGQERYNDLWCDFGGTPNKGEKPFKTAIREGYEELNGLFGNVSELEENVNNNLILSICYDKYTTYIFNTKLDYNLISYFNNLNNFAELHLKDKVNTHNGLFEKTNIYWFKINYLKNPKFKEYVRPHFHQHIDSIVKNEKFIISYIKSMKHDTHIKKELPSFQIEKL